MTDARGSTPQLIEGTVIKELKHRTKTFDFVNYRPTEFDPKSTAIEHSILNSVRHDSFQSKTVISVQMRGCAE